MGEFLDGELGAVAGDFLFLSESAATSVLILGGRSIQTRQLLFYY